MLRVPEDRTLRIVLMQRRIIYWQREYKWEKMKTIYNPKPDFEPEGDPAY